MSPRPDVSEERKSQILEAALAVFARLGFQQTRMDDIANQAGLSKGALYLYYKSKDAIIAALLEYFFTQEFKRLQKFIAVERQESISISEQLITFSREIASTLDWMQQFIPIAFEFYALAGRDQNVRQFLKDYYTSYQKELAHLIEHGIARGEFRAIDAQITATALVALYEGLALLYFIDPQTLQRTEQVETAVRLLLTGIQNHPSS
jgi:AcrR family transcriptional regulator